MKNYEDKIYSLGETVTGQTQAMSQAVQKTLENNGGVGIMTGYYDQNLSVLSVSNLLLHSTGYTFDSFMEQTNGSLKNFFYGEEDILDRDRFLQLHGAGESQILTADGTVNNVRLYKEDATDEAGRQIWVMSVQVNWDHVNLALLNEAICSGFWYFDCDENSEIVNASDDISVDINTAAQMFLEGKAAMFHGYPALMQEYQEQMDAELTRIPFFSQISDEAFINMTPSLNIAFNRDLEKDQEKLDLAFDVLDRMISKEGQTLIAEGKGVISLNVDVPNMMEDVPGLEDEINNNSVYIRYSAQKSFDASLKAVHGLLSGEMDETQAYDAFRSTMNSKDSKEKNTVNFENEYSISLNDKNGRDAASSILTTIREENDAQLALVPYYYFTSSIYKGECTGSRVALMTAKSSDTPLYLAKINGKEVYELAEKYLADSDEKFHVTNKYELPIASGMKIIVSQEENGFSLQDIEVNKKKTDKDKEYSILLTDTTMSVLKKINPECEIRQLKDTTLSSAWTAAMANGQQPSAPEDYIEVEK